jgi:hypothetical protein
VLRSPYSSAPPARWAATCLGSANTAARSITGQYGTGGWVAGRRLVSTGHGRHDLVGGVGCRPARLVVTRPVEVTEPPAKLLARASRAVWAGGLGRPRRRRLRPVAGLRGELGSLREFGLGERRDFRVESLGADQLAGVGPLPPVVLDVGNQHVVIDGEGLEGRNDVEREGVGAEVDLEGVAGAGEARVRISAGQHGLDAIHCEFRSCLQVWLVCESAGHDDDFVDVAQRRQHRLACKAALQERGDDHAGAGEQLGHFVVKPLGGLALGRIELKVPRRTRRAPQIRS